MPTADSYERMADKLVALQKKPQKRQATHTMPDGKVMKGATHKGEPPNQTRTPQAKLSPLDALAKNYLRTSGRLADDQVEYGGATGDFGSRTADLLVNQGVSDSLPLRAGALVGDIAFDPAWLVPGLGAAKAAQAAVPVAKGAYALRLNGMRGLPAYATAAGNPEAAAATLGKGARNIIDEGGPMQGAMLRYLGRHRSGDPSLRKNLLHPEDVPVVSGRRAGPSTYFAQTPHASDSTFSNFGKNIYRMGVNPSSWADTAKSKGYIDSAELLKRGLPEPDYSTKWSDPLIQKLRGEGYLGFKHGEAFTDWDVGAVPGVGLKKINTLGLPDVPGMFGARNFVDSVSEGLKEVRASTLDSIAMALHSNKLIKGKQDNFGARTDLPAYLDNFVKSRGMHRGRGEGFQDFRHFQTNPNIDKFIRRLDKILNPPPPPSPIEVPRGPFYKGWQDDVL